MESILPALPPSVSLASTTDSCVASFRAVYWCVTWRSYWWTDWIFWKLGIFISFWNVYWISHHSYKIFNRHLFKDSTDPWQQGSFIVMNEYLEKKLHQCQLSSKLLMELGKDHKKENKMVKSKKDHAVHTDWEDLDESVQHWRQRARV